MNIASWLYRSGLSHPAWPAAAAGTRVVATYGQLAERAARLAGALRKRFKLAPGERVAIAAKNSSAYLELLFGIWHAGLAAVPANAKLHGAEFGYILEHSGARICFASEGIDAEIATHAPPTLERLIAIGSAEYEELFAADPIAVAPRAGGDLAWLFYTSGTTGRPKGAMLSHRSLVVASHAYATEVDPVTPGDAILHSAPMSHGSGLYIMMHVARLGVQVTPESGGFEPGEIFTLFNAWPRMSMFAAPTMIKRLVACAADCKAENIRTLIWGGAPMYVEDALEALDRFGPRLAQIYGLGEAPMTISTLSKQDIADRGHPRWRERLASAGRPYACGEVRVADAQDAPMATGESGEILVPRPRDHGRLLARRRCHREDAAQRLAAHRGRWRFRCGGLSAYQGPLQGHDHFRRFQCLSARGRGSAAHPCEGARGFGHRPARPGMGRGGGGLCGGRSERGRTRRAVPFAHCALQTAEGLCFCRRAAEKQLRQDIEDGVARHGCQENRQEGREAMNEIDRKHMARCPLCGKPTDQAFKPFCSKRCADIDLNRWLSGVYAVPAKEDEDEDGERPADNDESEKS